MNSTDQQSETSQKKAICIIQLVIVYSVLTLTQSKYFVSYTIKLQCQLTQHKRCSERGQILSPNNFKKVLRNHIHIENIDQKINFYDSDETEIRLPFYRSFSTFQNVFGAGWSLHSSFLFMLMVIGKDKRWRKVIYLCCEIKKSYNRNPNIKP